MFVVQLHAARRRHYDFRLELGGVLVSWAVPKGPSLDPSDKRLAMHVEDHPLEYATFEGVIPEGNYGAGAVIVWDTGAWTPVEDPVAGLEKGKLLFDLHGYKLRGRWTLVRKQTSRKQAGDSGEPWLLIKKTDDHAGPGRTLDDSSVLSGLSVDELAAGPDKSAEIQAALQRFGAPRRSVDVTRLSPMLCHTAEGPFSNPDWIFELKYDGYRLLAGRGGNSAQLRYRSGADATRVFPEIAAAVAALPYDSFIMDGEVVVFGDDGRPVFNRLQQRTHLQGAADIRRASTLHPATIVIFDLLAFGGFDLRDLPLVVRKSLLQRLLPGTGPLRYADHIVERGEEMFEAVVERGLEGVVAKRADSTYVSQRSNCWLKVIPERVDDFAIVGYTSPQGSRTGFGSLHLAVWRDGRWCYAGRVGSGFNGRDLDDMTERLRSIRPWVPTFEPPSTPQRDDYWIEPTLVCMVRYHEWPEGGLLRFPRFIALREDKSPKECQGPAPSVRQAAGAASGHGDDPTEEPDGAAALAPMEPASPAAPAAGQAPLDGPAASEARDLRLTNLDKVFWPATDTRPAITKGQLIDYYREISPWLLPYLRDRPVVLIRYPDGIEGKSFFQKDAPEWVPDWLRTETLWSNHTEREINYFVCDDLDTLVYLVNMGTIPLHIWSSRVETLSQPDWTILDLDPKGAPFEHVIEVARTIHALCETIELPSFIKTSGQAGLHVLIPLGGTCTYEQSRTLAQLLAKIVETRLPELATTARSIERRGGKVYIDYVQNGHGRLIVSPFSARTVPGAPVSMPLRWSEVHRKLDPRRFTIDNAGRRMKRLGNDPLIGVLEGQIDLPRVLELLSEQMAEPA